jgi:hypothetical protein
VCPREESIWEQRGDSLVINWEKFKFFRRGPRYSYFDRTKYILKIERHEDDAFLRSRRFGKSLAASILAHFHGIEHNEAYETLFGVRSTTGLFSFLLSVIFLLTCSIHYLQGLAIHKNINAGWLGINRNPDLPAAENSLEDNISQTEDSIIDIYDELIRGNFRARDQTMWFAIF